MPRRDLILIVTVSVLLLVLWAVWAKTSPMIADNFLGDAKTEKAGQWGDSFGAFNALISSFALIGVLGTLWGQTNSIKQQDKTLKQQAQSLEIQREELKRQTEDQHRQRFESTFFEMLKLLRECRNQIEIQIDYSHKQGVDAFKAISEECSVAPTSNPPVGLRFSSYYANHLHPRYEHQLSPYFRVVYRVLERINDDSVLSEDEKVEYSRILRGQLTGSELTVLALNAQLPIAKHMPALLTRFRILKYAPNDAILPEIKGAFAAEAFQGRRA